MKRMTCSLICVPLKDTLLKVNRLPFLGCEK